MIETLLGISVGTLLGTVGGLALVVSLITQVLKNILPKSFPTKILVVIISMVLTVGFILFFGGITVAGVAYGIVGSFIVAFIAMYGWDSFKEMVDRFKYKEEK